MDKMKIAGTLRKLRGDRSRESVALAVGISPQAISNYETGLRVPTDDVKVRLAEFYQRTVQEIFYPD